MFDHKATPPSEIGNSGKQKASVPPLSPTEKRVCALLLQRLTEQRIAEHLERSPNTIHVHVRNIYRKLGVRTRRELYNFPGIVSMVISKD